MSIIKMHHARIALISGLACVLPLSASALDSTKIGTAALISPTTANSYYGNPTAPPTNSVGTTGEIPEIIELSRALRGNADEIYDFVRNYVDTTFIFGVQKGALGAIVDKSGTPFDQAQLMVRLLRQSGYTAGYQVGTITLNPQQFSDWTGITNARAACNLLASGGIPAIVNGTTDQSCTNIGASTTVTGVQLEHIWVTATISGTAYVFDPSYKPYDVRSSVANLASAAGLSTGQALTAATSGMTNTTSSGVGYVQGLNSSGLKSTLDGYAGSIRNYVQANNSVASVPVPLISGQIADLIGGSDIHYAAGPVRQTSLPYPATPSYTWTNVPDVFRTSLRVQLNYLLADGTRPQIIDRTLFVDEIYGRKLIFDTNFTPTVFSGALKLTDEFGNAISLQSYGAAQFPGYGYENTLTLTVNHPYAVDASSATATGTYMDAVVAKTVTYMTPFTIVNGWGDENRGLIEKWSSRIDGGLVHLPPEGCDGCVPFWSSSKGDGRREQIAAAWLVQASKAARLHAQLAGSTYTHHHTIGIVAGDTEIKSYNLTSPGEPLRQAYAITDNFDRVDVETAFSLTSKVSDAVARRGAVHAIAVTQAALEASAIAQIADLPDSSSVVTRFQWGNSPPVSEDPSALPSGSVGPRRFYEFNASNAGSASVVQPLLVTEGKATTTASDIHGPTDPTIGSFETTGRQNIAAAAITRYASAGFTAIASGEAFLGPGQRGGSFVGGQSNQYTHLYSHQRGGAMVATRYAADGVEPLEIAHITINEDVNIKGGGGGPQPSHESQYDPATAADALKVRFVDHSKALGVDPANGSVTYESPATLTVGSGGFPYALTASLIWRGGNEQGGFGPSVHTEPQSPWTTNWNNSLTVSGSGLEVMDGDIRASAGTIAAFLAMQDVYKGTVTRQREVTAVLVAGWWVNQLVGNVASVNVGANTRQFVKQFDGTWLATGAGPFATLTQGGVRVPYVDNSCGAFYALTRGWDASNVSFAVTNANGDVQNFGYWNNHVLAADNSCANVRGFRLNSWTFPQGVSVNLVYGPVPNGVFTIDELLEVNNSLGRKIHFVNSGLGGFDNTLAGADARSVSMSDVLGFPSITTITDQTGATTQVAHSLPGVYRRHLIDQVTDAANQPTLAYTYDSLMRVSEARDAQALQVPASRGPYQYFVAEHTRGERTDPAGGTYSVFYDTYQRPKGYMDELGRLTNVASDGRGRPTRYTYPEGNQELLSYDDHNNTTQFEKIPDARGDSQGGTNHILVTASWDQTWNKPAWICDGKCNRSGGTSRTDFVYYPSGNGRSLMQTATRPSPDGVAARPVYQFTYNSIGQLATSTDPTNLVLSNFYYPTTFDLQFTATDPSGVNSIISYTYYPSGDVKTVTDPRTYVTENFYDNDRRKTVVFHHDGSVTAPVIAAERTNYDVLGRVMSQEGGTAFSGVSVTAWQALKSLTYTATSKVRTEQNGAGNTTTYVYDALDRQIIANDPVNRNVGAVFDAAGQVLCTWRGWSSSTVPPASCSWDPNSYTGAGAFRYAAYSYGLDGEQATVLDANNNLTTNAYDGFDRLVRVTMPQATSGSGVSNAGDYEQYSYDDNGNRISKRTRDAQAISYTYDRLNRVTVKDLPGTTTGDVYYLYDAAGRPAHTWFGSSTSNSGVDYGYDTAKRLTSEATFGRTLVFGPDVAGNRRQFTFPDGNYFIYDFDGLNRASYIRENGAASGAGVLMSYAYDPLSRPQGVTRGNGTTTGFNFDAASRLHVLSHDLTGSIQDQTLTLDYTAASQLWTRLDTNNSYERPLVPVTQAYVPNGLNQYSSVGGTTYSYDGRGNLTSDGARTFTYDVENHLLSVTGGAGLNLTYDPLGRLAQATSGSTVTQFLYDGDRLVAEYSGATLIRRYVHGPGADVPVVWYEGNGLGTRQWLHPDERGSIEAVSDASGTGTIYTYGPYGEPDTWSGSRFRYTGQIMLPEAQLYHYKARVYDPNLGRFLQTDPVGYQDDVNFYAYGHNDAINKTDPSGTSCETTTDDQNHRTATSCKIDVNRDALAKKYGETAVKRLESAYKDAVNKLLARAGDSETLVVDKKADGKPTGETTRAEVKASTTANNLISREVSYNPGSSLIMGTSNTNEHNMFVGAGIDSLMKPTWYDGLLGRDAYKGMMQAWAHEGMHTATVHEQLGPRDSWYPGHDPQFNQAAWRLLQLTYP